ncbi:hypothetical protein CRX72_21860 [Pantoea sp. BRM17]|nr:hypothetical protein CRX72_21860 [Pantoea sp. BRM17]
MTLSRLQGRLGDGHFSLPGQIDIRQPVTRAAFQPELENIAIAPLLKALALPAALEGTLSLQGAVSTPVSSGSGTVQAAPVQPPVIAEPVLRNNADSPLNTLNLQLALKADQSQWRGLTLSNLQIDASNHLPVQGIKGALSGKAIWNADKQQFSLADLQLTANDSTLQGSAEGRIAMPQQLRLALHATSLNIDNL